jgi:hypothetical protein
LDICNRTFYIYNMLDIKSIDLILVIVAVIAVIFFFFVLTRLPADFIEILMINRLAVHELSELMF